MKKLNVTIVIGLLTTILGAGLVFAYGKGIDDRIAEGKRMVDVLVATEALPAGVPVADLADKVQLRKVPAAYVEDGALEDLDDVSSMVLGGPVAEGAQISRSGFSVPGELAVLAPEKGMLALAVGVDLSPGVARYLEPGDTVDVFVTYRQVSAPASSGATETSSQQGASSEAMNRTKLFSTGIRVLSVNVAAVRSTDGSTAAENGVATEGVTVVLEVPPAEAERIVNAVTLGEIYLAMSASGESHRTPKGVTPDDVVSANSGGSR
ncbi:MAG TPA: Flp pilus assembly protein CpaB [Actinomycetota bacterium]|nr:Flp pilus assembly protein CpaB [Actinomycetota bacterium]